MPRAIVSLASEIKMVLLLYTDIMETNSTNTHGKDGHVSFLGLPVTNDQNLGGLTTEIDYLTVPEAGIQKSGPTGLSSL